MDPRQAAPLGRCEEPTSAYLVGVALRSFFLVLATHLLAGEVDTTLGEVPLRQRLSWWCRYYNPLNLSWRYYSMFAYRALARCWGADQLVLINHEEHPFLPPLPYIVGETMSPLRLRRLEMAGLLSSQGILTFSAAYQGILAIQYTVTTEGIPYLPNVTVPLAMVGLFRVLACKWVASKIQVDPYPYLCFPASSRFCISHLWPFARKCKQANNADQMSTALYTMIHSSTDHPSSSSLPCIIRPHRHPLSSISASPAVIFPPSTPICNTEPASLPPSRIPENKPRILSPLNFPFTQPLSVRLPSYSFIITSPSALPYSPSGMQSSISPSLPKLSRPYSTLASTPPESLRSSPRDFFYAEESPPSRAYSPAFLPSQVGLPPSLFFPSDISIATGISTNSMLPPCTTFITCTCSRARVPISPSHKAPVQACQVHPYIGRTYDKPFDYKSKKLVVALWSVVLLGLVTMSLLPYKVAAAYKLPRTLLEFSMQTFYQYIAVTEFFFHGYLLLQGPRALANRVLFFNHWMFKVQTVGFYCLLTFMLVVALIDFVRQGYYRECA